MNKSERRIRNFSCGLKKLGNDNQNYIQKLTYDLFVIEKLSADSVFVKKNTEFGMNNVCTVEENHECTGHAQ